ncbi:MAG: hypothetical protein ACR2KB_09000 [Chitinophagaceae bacterium]
MKFIFSAFLLTVCSILFAQPTIDLNPFNNENKRKLYQRNHGAIIGIQRGSATSFEMGYEAHWRKLSLLKPHILGATANMEYNIANNVMGYKAGMWMKRGRVNLTYGGNLVYFNDFNGLNRYGLGPSVGFRLAGFHFINGLNLLAGDKELKANTLHASLRYYFPVENKFTWDRKTRKKKEQKKKERAKKKKEKEKENRKGIRKLLNDN